MKIKLAILIISSIFALSGCGPNTKPAKTSLEIQAIQSKMFETNKNTAFSSVISVFQDLGYIVKSADKETGFITAQSATKDSSGFWGVMAGVSKNSKTNATAFIEQLSQGTTNIRLNFVISNQSSSAYGQNSANDIVIEDPKVYENAFNKIGDAVFIRSAN